jgi:hypothetical protein
MKTCKTCKIDKTLEYFSKDKSRKDGYHNSCKTCNKNHRECKSEYFREKLSIWRINNPNYASDWQKDNLDKVNASSAKRRALKLRATPLWLTKEDLEIIESFYTLSKTIEYQTGVKHHVDHIVPLQGKNVCGLHVPWNLQVLEASENIRKSNKF